MDSGEINCILFSLFSITFRFKSGLYIFLAFVFIYCCISVQCYLCLATLK
uniref:Uncharacterized protein n=1 Tax=Octopus bimaculoides TaxID=37653 RepID=A0A0L8FL76_OCTBM